MPTNIFRNNRSENIFSDKPLFHSYRSFLVILSFSTPPSCLLSFCHVWGCFFLYVMFGLVFSVIAVLSLPVVIAGVFSSPLSFPYLIRESVKAMSGSRPNMTGKSSGMTEEKIILSLSGLTRQSRDPKVALCLPEDDLGNAIREKSRCKIAFSLYNHFCRRRRLDRRRSVETPQTEPR